MDETSTPVPCPFVVGPLDVGGVDVYVTTNDAEFADEVRWAMADLSTDPRPSAPQVRFATVRQVRPWVHWSMWRDAEPCELVMEESYVLFHQQWELNRIMLERTRHALHAATAVLDGRAVVFVGATMSGKTTCAGWLATHGGSYLGDEVTSINEDGTVTGFKRPLGLRSGGPLDGRCQRDGHQRSRFVGSEVLAPISSLGGRRHTGMPPRPGAIVFPRVHGESRTSLDRIGPAEALVGLCTASPSMMTARDETFAVLAGLVRRVPCATLSLGGMAPVAGIIHQLLGER